mmetsp:Transcript_23072/g.50354  ORF Transcript_23072/g.50354 Transcript_23072/m.50354 type:complete len:98 (-) Transcript_23072:121-414(-)
MEHKHCQVLKKSGNNNRSTSCPKESYPKTIIMRPPSTVANRMGSMSSHIFRYQTAAISQSISFVHTNNHPRIEIAKCVVVSNEAPTVLPTPAGTAHG